MRFFLTSFFLLISILSLESKVYAADKKIVIGSFSFPPLLHIAEDGTFSGTFGETVKLICEETAYECEFKVVPLKRAYADLRAGRVDALVTLDLGQFNECCVPSAWRAPWSAGLFSTLNKEAIPKSPEAMIGKSLIVVNGMRSPYSFLPNLDELSHAKKLKVFTAHNIRSSVVMFVRGRSPLLWGGEDFKWYLNKIAPDFRYYYESHFKTDVVLWTRTGKEDFIRAFNQAYLHLIETKALDEKSGMLIPFFMERRYKDALLEE